MNGSDGADLAYRQDLERGKSNAESELANVGIRLEQVERLLPELKARKTALQGMLVVYNDQLTKIAKKSQPEDGMRIHMQPTEPQTPAVQDGASQGAGKGEEKAVDKPESPESAKSASKVPQK